MALEQATCEACRRKFGRPRALKNNRRCPECIAGGRKLCAACGIEITVSPTARGQSKCDACKAAGRSVRQGDRAERQAVTCRGVVRFGAARHSAKCARAFRRTTGELARIASFEPGSKSIISHPCHLLALRVEATIKDGRGLGMRSSLRSWSDYDELSLYLGRRRMAEKLRPGWTPDAAREDERAQRRQHNKLGLTMAEGQMLRAWKRVPGKAIRQCPVCEKLLMARLASDADVKVHWPCWRSFLRTPEGAAWMSARRTGSPFLTEPQLPTRRGRRRQSADLTRDFGWTVRHLIGRETLASIARENHLTYNAVSLAVKGILALLPDTDVAGRWLTPYVLAFRKGVASA